MAEVDGPVKSLDDALGDAERLAGAGEVVEEDGELVTPEPGDGVVRTHAAAQPLGDGDEQPVARLVAEAVVDVLEVVEVDEHHREQRAALGAAVERGAVDPPAQERAVGQAGERVVIGLVLERLLALAQVPHQPQVVGEGEVLPHPDEQDEEQQAGDQPGPSRRELTVVASSSTVATAMREIGEGEAHP